MHYNKYAYRTPQKPKSPDNLPYSPPKEYLGNRPQSPKYKVTPRPPPRDNYFVQEIRQNHYSPKPHHLKSQEARSFDPRLKTLIFETLSSADQVAKELLHYGQIQSETICSTYFLNREKLYSLISNENNQLWEMRSAKSSKKSGWKQGQSGSSEGTQEIPINHLQRLEKIVYNQVIPILETEFAYQRRKIQKKRKPQQWAYTDIKQGLILLQRLNQKNKKSDLEDYAEVLEKFIRRVMDKQESLMGKLMKLQQKLQVETRKTEMLSKQFKKKESQHERGLEQSTLEKETRTIIQNYQHFTKEVKTLLKEGSSKDSSPRPLKTELGLIVSQLKNALHQEEKGKICVHKEHKYQKQLHSGCLEEHNRSQKQIKNLKEVIITLQKETETLKQECEVLEVKLRKSTEKLSKLENKSTRLKQQNQELMSRLEHLGQENNYKNNLIADYLNDINRLQEQLKQKDDSCTSLQEENERSNEVIIKKSEDHHQLLRHLEQLEERNKELEEMEDKAHRDLEEMVQKNYVREFEVTHITNTYQRQVKEMQELKEELNEKNKLYKQTEDRNKRLLKDLQTQGIQPSTEVKDAEVQVEADLLTSQQVSNFLNPQYKPPEDYTLLLQSLQMNPNNQTNRQTLDFINQIPQRQLQNTQNFQQINPFNQYIPFPMNGPPNMAGYGGSIPLRPNPFNQNYNAPNVEGRLPENNQNMFQIPEAMHQHMPNIMNNLGNDPNKEIPPNLQSQNTEETPKFDPNVLQGTTQEEIHHQYRKTIGQGYANFFNDLNIRNSQNQNVEEPVRPKPLEDKETDIQILHQTIELLQNGLKKSQKQIEYLKNQNELLLTKNQELLKSSRGRELMPNPFNLGIPNNSYNSAQEEFNHIQREFKDDYIPGHINRQIIQEVIKDLDQQKKATEQRSFTLEQEINLLKKESQMIDEKNREEQQGQSGEKKRRDDWDAGHRFRQEDFEEGEIKKERRQDWDAGHRFREEDFEEGEVKKERRQDWDVGHRYQEQQDNIQIAIVPQGQIKKSNIQQCQQQANPEDNIIDEEQKKEQVKERKGSIQIPKMYEEFIQEKEPTVEELFQESDASEKKKSDMIGIQSQKEKLKLQLIKIDDKEQEISEVSNCVGLEDDRKSRNPDERQKGSDEIEPPPEIPKEVEEYYKLKQLLEITQKIKQKMANVLEKQEGVNYKEELSDFLKGMQSIQNLLIICKKNTTKKVIRLKKIQGLRKEAEEQIKALQKKLQSANMYISNISNEQGSALSFPDQLQELLRLKAPYGDILKLAEESSSSKTKEVVEQEAQTDNFYTLESSVRKIFPADFKKFLSGESLANSFLNQSFIEELQNLSVEKLPNEEAMKKLQSAFMINQSLKDPLGEPESPANTPESENSESGSENLKRSRVKMQSEVRNLGTIIEFHKNRILSLHDMMMRKTNSLPVQKNDLSLSTPLRKPVLENQKYLDQINKAPKKGDYENILQKIESSENRENEMKELQEMFKNRENEFQTILIQRNEEIERLKAIMKKITENPPQEGKTTPRQSRNREANHHQMEEMKSKFEVLELALEKQKTENQKLKLELKEQETQKEMLKMKFRQTYQLQINSFREPDHDYTKPKSDNPKSDHPKSNQEKILANIELNEEDKEDDKKKNTDKVELISGQNPSTEEKVKQEEPQPERQVQVNQKERAIKRFSRQSERVSRESQSEPKGSNSEVRPDSGWKDLFPEYFGKKDQKR